MTSVQQAGRHLVFRAPLLAPTTGLDQGLARTLQKEGSLGSQAHHPALPPSAKPGPHRNDPSPISQRGWIRLSKSTDMTVTPWGVDVTSPGGKNRKTHELTRQARSPSMFCLPEPNYTKSQCDRAWRVAAPKGLGPMKKCRVMVKVPPPHPHPAAPGTGQNKAS